MNSDNSNHIVEVKFIISTTYTYEQRDYKKDTYETSSRGEFSNTIHYTRIVINTLHDRSYRVLLFGVSAPIGLVFDWRNLGRGV